MRTLARRLLVALLLVGASAGTARAQSSTFFIAELLGINVVPPAATPASGLALLVYDVGTRTFEIGFAFDGLTAPAIGAHIRRGAEGGTGAAVFDLTSALPGGTSGTAEPRTGTLSGADEALLFGDGLYVELQTSTYPDGEIRGNLVYLAGPVPSVVPEPASAALLAAGLVGVGGVAARRRGRTLAS